MDCITKIQNRQYVKSGVARSFFRPACPIDTPSCYSGQRKCAYRQEVIYLCINRYHIHPCRNKNKWTGSTIARSKSSPHAITHLQAAAFLVHLSPCVDCRLELQFDPRLTVTRTSTYKLRPINWCGSESMRPKNTIYLYKYVSMFL